MQPAAGNIAITMIGGAPGTPASTSGSSPLLGASPHCESTSCRTSTGAEQYERENGSIGLAALKCHQVELGRREVVFQYIGKSGKVREHQIIDGASIAAMRTLLHGRDGEEEFLAWRSSPRSPWVDVKSHEINAYLRESSGLDLTAKDFRTWHATVLAAVGLAVSAGVESEAAQKRAIARVVREVSEYLGNTPAVARASYIDPRVIDRYRAGEVIDVGDLADGAALGELATFPIEPQVLDLLGEA
jgi:DNA topoisomerase IB